MIPKGLNLQLSLSAFVFLIFSCGEKGEDNYSCSFIVDGERKSASSKSACEDLEKEADLSDSNAEKASADSTKIDEEDSEKSDDRGRGKSDDRGREKSDDRGREKSDDRGRGKDDENSPFWNSPDFQDRIY